MNVWNALNQSIYLGIFCEFEHLKNESFGVNSIGQYLYVILATSNTLAN
jgi:hypothetical protein